MSAEICPPPTIDIETDAAAIDHAALSAESAPLRPRCRIRRAHELFAGRLVLPTTFGPTAPVMLRLVSETIPDVPVVTIRHGYETPRTLELAAWYEQELELDVRTYEAPRLAIPEDDAPEFEEFQRRIKVEPFQRMLDDLPPRAYLSGRMRWQTPERAELPFVESKGSVLAFNPIADVTPEGVADLFAETGLPMNDDYFDPAKGYTQQRECQLNTSRYR